MNSSPNHTIAPNELPVEISAGLGGESIDFVTKSTKNKPAGKALKNLFFGLLWTSLSGIFVIAFFGPILRGEDLQLEINGSTVTANLDHLGPIVVPGLIISLFLVIGLAIIGWSLYDFSRKGAIFVATPDRLIKWNGKRLVSYDWEQFTGSIEVIGDNEKATLSLELRTGRKVRRRNHGEEYLPDAVDIVGISGAFEIEGICRKRIKENDPNPAQRVA